MFLFSGGLSGADAARLRRIEQKLDLILQHLGLNDAQAGPAQKLSADVRRLADDGQKIEAIKLLRAQTGFGLKEAKDAVDAYLGGS
jgi:ribosomal protein L7/L12